MKAAFSPDPSMLKLDSVSLSCHRRLCRMGYPGREGDAHRLQTVVKLFVDLFLPSFSMLCFPELNSMGCVLFPQLLA